MGERKDFTKIIYSYCGLNNTSNHNFTSNNVLIRKYEVSKETCLTNLDQWELMTKTI